MKRTIEIDGARFSSLEGFYDEVSARLIPGAEWGRNLDAFNDILRGGFGTPEKGFVLVWKNHALARDRLGHAETPAGSRAVIPTIFRPSRESSSQQRRARGRPCSIG